MEDSGETDSGWTTRCLLAPSAEIPIVLITTQPLCESHTHTPNGLSRQHYKHCVCVLSSGLEFSDSKECASRHIGDQQRKTAHDLGEIET